MFVLHGKVIVNAIANKNKKLVIRNSVTTKHKHQVGVCYESEKLI